MRTRAALPASSTALVSPTSPSPQNSRKSKSEEGGPIAGLAPLGTAGGSAPHPDTGWWAGSWLVPFTFGHLPKLPCTVSLLPNWIRLSTHTYPGWGGGSVPSREEVR